jgi:hypothetical protein
MEAAIIPFQGLACTPSSGDRQRCFRQGPAWMRFIIDGVSDKMNFEDICQIVDSVADLPYSDKTALLRDLAHRAAKPLNVDGNIVFNALFEA